MAFVHPSRAAVVPGERRSPEGRGADAPLRIRGRAAESRGDRAGHDGNGREVNGRDGDGRREGDGRRDYDGRRDRQELHGREHRRERDRRDGDDGRRPRERWDRRSPASRASPSYTPPPPAPVPAGPPIRLGFDGPPPLGLPPFQRGPGRTAGSGARNPKTDLEERRRLRDAAEVDIWPPSPERPAGSPEPVPARQKRRSRRYASETDDSEDEYERRRRRRRREREREGREKRRARERSARSERSGRSERSESRAPMDDEPEVGPVAPAEYEVQLDRDAYARLLPGEGAAMAAYLQKGERIPRRGEIGIDPAKIASYEAAGFVMSGSRHVRMNAVRQRKEAQVVSAEEKRAALLAQRESAQAREGAIISQFREMVDERLAVEERRARERGREQRGREQRDKEREERGRRA